MNLLVGSETVGTGATSAIGKEEALAFQFTALESGTVEAVVFHTGTAESAATSVRVAIVADAAGQPGPILAGEEQVHASKPGENTTIEVPGFSTPVVEGTKYWLILLPLGGSLKIKLHKSGEAGGTSSRESSSPSKAKTIAEITLWAGLGTEGPIFLAGRGEAGKEPGKLEAKMPLTGSWSASPKGNAVLSASSTATSTWSAKATASGVLKAALSSTSTWAAKAQAKGVLAAVSSATSVWNARLKGKAEAARKIFLALFDE